MAQKFHKIKPNILFKWTQDLELQFQALDEFTITNFCHSKKSPSEIQTTAANIVNYDRRMLIRLCTELI